VIFEPSRWAGLVPGVAGRIYMAACLAVASAYPAGGRAEKRHCLNAVSSILSLEAVFAASRRLAVSLETLAGRVFYWLRLP